MFTSPPQSVAELKVLFKSDTFPHQSTAYYTLLAEHIATLHEDVLDETNTFSDEDLLLVTKAVHVPLMEQVVKRLPQGLTLQEPKQYWGRMLGAPNHWMPQSDKVKTCELLFPLLTKNDQVDLLRDTIFYALPLACEYVLSKIKLSAQERDNHLCHLLDQLGSIDRTQKPEEWSSVLEIMDILKVSHPDPIKKEAVLSLAIGFGVPMMEQLSDKIPPKLFAKRLFGAMSVDSLSSQEIKEDSTIYKIFECLYKKGQDFILTFNDEQLEFLYPKEKYDVFWEIHDPHRLHSDMTSALQSTANPHTPKRKI